MFTLTVREIYKEEINRYGNEYQSHTWRRIYNQILHIEEKSCYQDATNQGWLIYRILYEEEKFLQRDGGELTQRQRSALNELGKLIERELCK